MFLCNCQKEQEDVNLLFEKETVHLERCQHQREQEVLSAVVEVKTLLCQFLDFFNGGNS